MGPACEVSHLSCFALLLCPDFIFTPAVPLFFFALTLLCSNFFFRAHLPCCAIIFFRARLELPCCALKIFFFAHTYLAVPLLVSCFALTLLCAKFFFFFFF